MHNAGFQALLTVGLIASLSQAIQTPPRPAASETAKPEKKVCKAIVKTGSMLAQRFCLTKAEWQEFNDINGETVDSFLHKRGTGMCDGSCQKQSNR